MTFYTSDDFERDLAAGPSHWPGMYAKYFLTEDGGILSYRAACDEADLIKDAIQNGDDAQWHVISCETAADFDGDYELTCDHTGETVFDPND